MCASFFTGAVPAVNAETVSLNSEYGDLTYALVDENDDGKNDYVKIVECNMYVKGNLEIPVEIEGLPVRVIGDNAYINIDYVENPT